MFKPVVYAVLNHYIYNIILQIYCHDMYYEYMQGNKVWKPVFLCCFKPIPINELLYVHCSYCIYIFKMAIKMSYAFLNFPM